MKYLCIRTHHTPEKKTTHNRKKHKANDESISLHIDGNFRSIALFETQFDRDSLHLFPFVDQRQSTKAQAKMDVDSDGKQ